MKNRSILATCLALLLLLLNACTTTPPQNKNNLCAVFREKNDWFDATWATYRKWGVPVPVQMAIMFQESSFIADARPPYDPNREVQSSAFGYAQAKDETWDHYLSNAQRNSADRDDFADASDFIGWYCHLSFQKLHLSKANANDLYLAYHEGHGGYSKQSYLKKAWLMRTAQKVAQRATTYSQQLSQCKEEFSGNN